MNLKKFIIVNFISLMMTGVFISFNQNNSQLEPEAAVNETNRIWVDVNSATWGQASANTYLYVFGGTGGAVLQSWPGILLITGGNSTSSNYESGNSKWFYDAPTQYTKFFFTRRDPSNNNEWARTKDFDILDNNTPSYLFTLDYDVTDDRTVSNFTATNTTVVSNLANSIDTSSEACSSASAQSAIDAYNNMATFDQNQFDTLDVDSGAGVTTGIQRLQYLKDFYNISTALN